MLGQQPAGDRGRAVLVHPQRDPVAVDPDQLPVRLEQRRVDRADRRGDRLALRVPRGQLAQAAVVEDPAGVDDDHPLAQRLHVGHVMAGEQHGGAAAGVVLGQERADPLLHRHVEPDGRLVQEQHLRAVQQRAGDLRLHPLAEGELAHRLADLVADVHQLDQLVPDAAELRLRDPVDRPVHLVRVERGQVPLQLVAVAHDQRDPAQEGVLAAGRQVPEHPHVAGGREQQPGQHLQRRGLASTVRAEETDHLTGLHGEVDPGDRDHVPGGPPHQAAQRGPQAALPLRHPEGLRQPGHVDVWLHARTVTGADQRFSGPCRPGPAAAACPGRRSSRPAAARPWPRPG